MITAEQRIKDAQDWLDQYEAPNERSYFEKLGLLVAYAGHLSIQEDQGLSRVHECYNKLADKDAEIARLREELASKSVEIGKLEVELGKANNEIERVKFNWKQSCDDRHMLHNELKKHKAQTQWQKCAERLADEMHGLGWNKQSSDALAEYERLRGSMGNPITEQDHPETNFGIMPDEQKGEWKPLFQWDNNWNQISLYNNGTIECRDGSGVYFHFSEELSNKFLNWLDNRPDGPVHELRKKIGKLERLHAEVVEE